MQLTILAPYRQSGEKIILAPYKHQWGFAPAHGVKHLPCVLVASSGFAIVVILPGYPRAAHPPQHLR